MLDISKTVQETKRYVTLDWLTASFNIDLDIYEFINEHLHLDCSDFLYEVGGVAKQYHYARTAKFDSIHVYYSTAYDIENGANRGFTLNLSGKACRQFEILNWTSNQDWTWYDTLSNLYKLDCKFTRLDIAQDLINSKYTWQFLLKKIYEKTLIYRGKVERYNKINTKTGEDYHASIYIGSKPQQLNIYDKKGERLDRAGEDYDIDSWTRWELRLFADKAHIAVLELISGRQLGDLFSGILAAHYRFVTLTGDKNRSRRVNAGWWIEFLNDAKATKLLVKKDKPTLKSKENWLENHGPDKAELLLYLRDFFVYGSDHAVETLMKRVQSQREKLTNLDIQVLYHGIMEECHKSNIISEYRTHDIINKIHELLYSDIHTK